ncbi:MAG TPA: MarR family transcriptional regulator [Ornithinimicrobium sp.]|uniref:MarR family winged helix-turn-helix transcriptional regulator n=1 Tax=Ornithinimicrobium sp. TaxID=1977084 RepID=UPI002B494717|nr:MarR family transcriptional regulator [Ornithinimicrobium sp.]HKJ12075.1 MarR family transcriptional regulator [Ornithinimicrobium sp.]
MANEHDATARGLSATLEEGVSTPRWLDDDEQRAWRACLRGYRSLIVAMETGLTGTGVRLAEYEALSMLSEAPGERLRMSALAELVVQSRSRLTHAVKRLEGMGLVQRSRIAHDGRGVEVSLTRAGLHLVQELAPLHIETVRLAFLDQMSREELLVMGTRMERVMEAAASISSPEGTRAL